MISIHEIARSLSKRLGARVTVEVHPDRMQNVVTAEWPDGFKKTALFHVWDSPDKFINALGGLAREEAAAIDPQMDMDAERLALCQ